MVNTSLVLGGKLLSQTFKRLNLGNGSTWPGHLALSTNKRFIQDLLQASNTKVIIVAGTNGKTTTTKLLQTILEKNGHSVLHNSSGANLLNGIASTLILNASLRGKLRADYAILEVDENALPLVLKEITPDFLVLNNLFRDQLDRYGEVTIIARKWQEAFSSLSDKTVLILNADDPQIAYFGQTLSQKVYYYGLSNLVPRKKSLEHAVDSIYCPRCGEKLIYSNIFFSHLGTWECRHCHLTRPTPTLSEALYYPLPGMYNRYNSLAAYLVAKLIGVDENGIYLASKHFTPAFGRQEKIVLNNKSAHVFLSKNPTGFNESLRTVKELGGKKILLVLNDRIPDGKDVSWIWDTELESITDGNEHFFVSGDRVFDIALRLKYAGIPNEHIHPYPSLHDAVHTGLKNLDENETLYILPTYSAMLETRKILTGREIL